MANLYIISGCNGAGKTTASFTILPEMLNCKEFVNADEIAKGLSPFQPETISIEAGRIMLSRIRDLINQGVDFAFETTLASKYYSRLAIIAQEKGYTITLIYFWLSSPELAMARVKSRVMSGGHSIPSDVILRRYYGGITNLTRLYLPLSDYWILIDNSESPFQIIAEGSKNNIVTVFNDSIYNKILNS
jgi:predicted ABC-type ATPase